MLLTAKLSLQPQTIILLFLYFFGVYIHEWKVCAHGSLRETLGLSLTLSSAVSVGQQTLLSPLHNAWVTAVGSYVLYVDAGN